ncbi:MAG: SPOR domain-containing protein [Nitrospiria bacterium]
MADEEEDLQELREIQYEEDVEDDHEADEMEVTQPPSSPNKFLIGILSILVFLALFMFFKEEEGQETQEMETGPTISAPSADTAPVPSITLPKEEAFQDATIEEPSAGDILIQSEGERPDSFEEAEVESVEPDDRESPSLPDGDIPIFEAANETLEDPMAPAPSEMEITASLDNPGFPEENRFSIQLGAFKSKASASVFSERLRSSGYDSYIDHEGGTLFRVRVGAYRTREAAKKVADRIKASEHLDTFIVIR